MWLLLHTFVDVCGICDISQSYCKNKSGSLLSGMQCLFKNVCFISAVQYYLISCLWYLSAMLVLFSRLVLCNISNTSVSIVIPNVMIPVLLRSQCIMVPRYHEKYCLSIVTWFYRAVWITLLLEMTAHCNEEIKSSKVDSKGIFVNH